MDHFFLISVAPTVKLSLGRMVNPQDLEEDDDIYFTCEVNANPPAYKLTWWHNVSTLILAASILGNSRHNKDTQILKSCLVILVKVQNKGIGLD